MLRRHLQEEGRTSALYGLRERPDILEGVPEVGASPEGLRTLERAEPVGGKISEVVNFAEIRIC